MIEGSSFPLAPGLKLVALQGDCSVKAVVESSGGRYVVDNAERSRQSCMDLIARARAERAHLALIPEMVIPQAMIDDLIAAVGSSPEPLVLVGGIEGLSPVEYRALVLKHGGTPTYLTSSLVLTLIP